MIAIARFATREDAYVARGRLAAFNIRADVTQVSAFPGVFGASLEVDERDKRTALDILARTEDMIDASKEPDFPALPESAAITPDATLPQNPADSSSPCSMTTVGLLSLLGLGYLPWILASVPVCFGFMHPFDGSAVSQIADRIHQASWLLLAGVMIHRWRLPPASLGLDGRKMMIVHAGVGWLVCSTSTQLVYGPLFQATANSYGMEAVSRSFLCDMEIPFALRVIGLALHVAASGLLILLAARGTRLLGWPWWLSVLAPVALLGISQNPAWTIYDTIFTLSLSCYYLAFNCGISVFAILLIDWLHLNAGLTGT